MGFTVTPITLPSFDLTVTSPLQVTIRGSYVLQKQNSPLIMPGIRINPNLSSSDADSSGWILSARYWIYAHPDYTTIQPIYQNSISVNCPDIPSDPFQVLYTALKATYPGTYVDN